MPTEITFLDGNLTIIAGDKPVRAVPYAVADDALLVGNGHDERDGEIISELNPGTRLEAGSTHTFCTGDGVRFVVEEIEPAPAEDPAP